MNYSSSSVTHQYVISIYNSDLILGKSEGMMHLCALFQFLNNY